MAQKTQFSDQLKVKNIYYKIRVCIQSRIPSLTEHNKK